jgi:hypothetical protein
MLANEHAAITLQVFKPQIVLKILVPLKVIRFQCEIVTQWSAREAHGLQLRLT